MTFVQIPNTLRVPGAYGEIADSGEIGGFSLKPIRALLIGQHLQASLPNSGNPKRVFNETDVEDLAGRGSILHLMGRAWFAQNRVDEVHVIALDDAGGAVAATGQLTVTATSASAGVYFLYIAGQQVRVTISQGDNAAAICAAIVAAVNGKTDLPVTATDLAPMVTLTARNAGEIGNDIRVHENLQFGEDTPAGMSVAITQVGGVVAGASNPLLSGLWAKFPETQFDLIVHGFSDTTNLNAQETEAAARFDALVALDMYCVSAKDDTVSNLLTFGDTRNDEHSTVFGVENGASPTWEIAAAAAARMARNIATHPALPFAGLELTGLQPPIPADRFSFAERDGLLNDGVATVRVVNERLQVERAISTRQETDAGSPSIAYLDSNVHHVLSFMRWDWVRRHEAAFQGYVIGENGRTFDPRTRVTTEQKVRDFGAAILTQWAENAILEDLEGALASLTVARNSNEPGRIDTFVDVNLANGLQITAAQIRFTN